jgi:HlyD family secretion protein
MKFLPQFKLSKTLKKKKTIFYGALVLFIGLVFFLFVGGNGNNAVATEKAKIQTLAQEISVTGKVKPLSNVELSFDSGGRVLRVYKKIGGTVKRGEIIATLENGELAADLQEAEANLKVQEAELSQVLRGSRKEEIAIDEAELQKAEQDLANYFDDIPDILNDALVDADDALNKQTFQMFTNPNSSRPELSFFVSNFQKKIDAESARLKANDAVKEMNTLVNMLSLSKGEREISLINAQKYLTVINSYLSMVFDALSDSTNLSDTTKDTYKANVTTARGNITSALSTIGDQLQSIASQKTVVAKMKNELALTISGATKEDIEKAKARVEEARAQVTRARARLAKTIITSPISGIVSRIDVEVGETVSGGDRVVDVISQDDFEIEVDVPEIDIAKLSVGNKATLTLDPYGSQEIFSAEVFEVEPAERVVDGISTYKTTLVFIEKDPRIKAGMTANIVIETAKKEKALVVPQRAIFKKENKEFVRVLKDGKTEEVQVSVGLYGEAGLVEIVSGLSEGDEVVTSLK